TRSRGRGRTCSVRADWPLPGATRLVPLGRRIEAVEREDRPAETAVLELPVIGGGDALAVERDGRARERRKARAVMDARLQQQVALVRGIDPEAGEDAEIP